MKKEDRAGRYTCSDYRMEMMLISLRNRIRREDIREDEKRELEKEISRIESEMGMD